MKFKELVSKLHEKKAYEEGTPETTAAYAKATPGQPPVVFDTDIQYDGHKVAAELDPSGNIKHQMGHALSRQDNDADGDVDSMDKKNDNIPDEVTGAEKKNLTLTLIKKGAKERAHTKKGVAYEGVAEGQIDETPKVDRVLSGKEETRLDEDQTSEWQQIQSMEKGEITGGKEGIRKRIAYLNAVLAFQKKYGKDTVKTRKSIGALNRTRISEEVEVEQRNEEKDEREYGYEGDMAISQLKTITRHADHMMGMLKEDTDLPEWVQSKITLATDYMQTAHDYMMSEMTESYDGRVLGRITSKEINKVLGSTKNAAQGVEALKKAFKVTDAQAKAMLDRVMKESVEQIDESEDKTIGRLKQLVRFGLMDKSKLAILSRSMKSLEKGQVTNPTERATLFELLNELIGVVTGDDAMFAKVRMNVQKEEFDKED